jgi:hypothetical protein
MSCETIVDGFLHDLLRVDSTVLHLGMRLIGDGGEARRGAFLPRRPQESLRFCPRVGRSVSVVAHHPERPEGLGG